MNFGVPICDRSQPGVGEAPPAGDARRELGRRLQRRLGVLTEQVVAALVASVPFYAQLPEEQLRGDITDICRHNLRVFLRALAGGGRPGGADLAAIETSATRRAGEGVPLDAVLHAYQVGLLHTWRAVQQEATAGERGELPAVATEAMAYIAEVTRLVAAAYLEEREALTGERRSATQQLVQALLAGTATVDLAAGAGLQLAGNYTVVALGFDPSSDKQLPTATEPVALRRKLRRIERHLEQVTGGTLPALLGVDGGVVLLPTDAAGVTTVDAEELVGELARAAGAPVTAGVSFRPGLAAVPEASSQAHDVLRIASALGLTPGAYRLDDVLVEHALAGDRAGLERLSSMLEPLRPDLVGTVEVYLRCDLDRRRAAALLHIHPNSVDYRLRRVKALTGLDAGTTRGVQLLGAAVVALRLVDQRPTGGRPTGYGTK